jgi:hypothetical protein
MNVCQIGHGGKSTAMVRSQGERNTLEAEGIRRCSGESMVVL